MSRRKRPVIGTKRKLPEDDAALDDPRMAREAILEAVENQLKTNSPPEARASYERLRREGHSAEEARRLIGMALAAEVWHVLHDNAPYNHERYAGNLRRLPAAPWDEHNG